MKNLISKNPVLRFLSGKKFNMSRLIRRSDGKYLDKNGNIVTGNDGNLLGDAWKYLAGKYGVNYANRVSWNTRNKNIYLNGKWRADYKPSGNVTVDWNTATNNGKASKVYKDIQTGRTTYFNKSDKPTSKLNTPKKNVAKGNDGQQKNSNSNKLSDNLLYTPSTFFKVRHSPLATIMTGGIPGGYLILNTIDNPSILRDIEKTIIAPSLPGGYYLDEYITNPDFREPVNRFSLNAGKWLLGLKKGGNILKYLNGSPLFRNKAIQKGWTRNYGNELWNKITDDLKNILKSTGLFTDDSFKDAKSLLTALNNYLRGKNGSLNTDNTLSQIAVDNKWGDLSLRAFDEALSAAQYLLYSPSFTVTSNYIPYYPNALMLFAPKISLSTPTYDRSGIRNVLREFNLRPYGYSGALRKALRMMANNTYDDNDKLLVRLMNLPQTLLERLKISLKKGGLIKV